MNIGTAYGGPRDGVRLSAGSSWDGRVRTAGSSDSDPIKRYYPGYYVWSVEVSMWVWIPSNEPAVTDSYKVTRTPRTWGYSRKPPTT